MNLSWEVWCCLGLGMASAMVGGVFLAFSDFVMRGLGDAEPAHGMEAMQQINRTVYRSIFLTTFMALVPITIGWALYVGIWNVGPIRTLAWAAAGVYLLSVFVVTAAGNVPMNQHLDNLPISGEAFEYWTVYLRTWTLWNHLRTLGSFVTSFCYLLSAVLISK